MEGWLVSALRRPMRGVLARGVSAALAELRAEAERRHAATGHPVAEAA